jgi:hypothetical protein
MRRLELLNVCATAASLLLVLTLSLGIAAEEQVVPAPWDMEETTSGRITVRYPTWMPDEDVQWFIEDRERALTFTEQFFDTAYQGHVTYEILTSLISYGGTASPTEEGGIIRIAYPYGVLTERDWIAFNMLFGCHEETHLVTSSFFGWTEEDLLRRSRALVEGIAEVAHSSFCGITMDAYYTAALKERGELLGISDLLCLHQEWPVGESTRGQTTAYHNLYHAGASLTRQLIASIGHSRFLEMLDVCACPAGPLVYLAEESDQVLVLPTLERLWHREIEDWPDDTLRCGEILLRANDSMLEWTGLLPLEGYWLTSSFKLIGPSTTIPALFLFARMGMLGIKHATDEPDDDLDLYAQGLFEIISAIDGLLDTWLGAVRSYEAALEISLFGASCGLLTELVTAAEVGYREAGDLFMADRCSTWIGAMETFDMAQQLADLGANPDVVLDTARTAESGFDDAGDISMAERVVAWIAEVQRGTRPLKNPQRS